MSDSEIEDVIGTKKSKTQFLLFLYLIIHYIDAKKDIVESDEKEEKDEEEEEEQNSNEFNIQDVNLNVNPK